MADDVSTPWYRPFFGDDYLRVYAPRLTPQRTAQEVEGIVKLLGLPAGSAILDLCCGHGRHAIPLAQRGYRVTGQDLSETFLRQAEASAAAVGVRVQWVRRDMREMPFESEFDAVINVFTAFGYFEREADDQRVLEEVQKALKPGGVFLLETMHRDALARRFQPYGITRHEDGLLVLEERRFDQVRGRNDVLLTMIHADGRRVEHRHSVRIYTATELASMCAAAGLPVDASYGGLDGSPLTLDSRLALLCRKPAAKAAG
jgi:SAM-dependent methyltransferase